MDGESELFHLYEYDTKKAYLNIIQNEINFQLIAGISPF